MMSSERKYNFNNYFIVDNNSYKSPELCLHEIIIKNGKISQKHPLCTWGQTPVMTQL